jgi:hypothetical protein
MDSRYGGNGAAGFGPNQQRQAAKPPLRGALYMFFRGGETIRRLRRRRLPCSMCGLDVKLVRKINR